MHLLHILVVVLIGAVTNASSKVLQNELGSFTGHLVKALVKATWALQKKIRKEINAGHAYVNAAILERLKNVEENKEVKALKSKMKDEFVLMLDIDKHCISNEGVVWIANRALLIAEKYRELYICADILEVCGFTNTNSLNETCSSIIDRYEESVLDIERSVHQTAKLLMSIFDGTMECLRFRYDSLLRSLKTKTF